MAASTTLPRETDLLYRVKTIVACHEQAARRQGLKFNVFDILDRTRDEVKGHSAFLAELLNPRGSHGQGGQFLRLFIEQLKEANYCKSKEPARSIRSG